MNFKKSMNPFEKKIGHVSFQNAKKMFLTFSVRLIFFLNFDYITKYQNSYLIKSSFDNKRVIHILNQQIRYFSHSKFLLFEIFNFVDSQYNVKPRTSFTLNLRDSTKIITRIIVRWFHVKSVGRPQSL